jgi:transmembrane sensor
MNSFHRVHDPAAEEQASLWAARLEGSTLEASDRIALDAWLAEKPSHRALLSEYCQFSADLEQQLPVLVASGAATMPAFAAPVRRRWNLGWLSLAGAGLAAAAIALVVWTGHPAPKPETLATSVAQRQAFVLSDGTRVELNAQTSLVVENTSDERRVRLASGEAFFSVAKDKSRPFIVETPSGSVRVTGTVFDVRTDKGSELDVTVVEGSVQVRPGEAASGGMQPPSALTANMRLTADGKVLVRSISAEDVEDVLAWRQGKIVFDKVPLRAAITQVARYHGRGITVSDAAAGVHTLGGRWDLDDLDKFLRGVSEAFELDVVRDPNSGAIRVTARNEK